MNALTTRVDSITVIRELDEYPDLSWLDCPMNYEGEPPEDIAKYVAQDKARLAAYERGDWHMLGIVASADVYVRGVRQTFRSSGLWGIESDSDESYLQEIEEEQRAELMEILKELGIPT